MRAASFTIYTGTKDTLHKNGYFLKDKLSNVAIAGALGGALSGSLISVGSTRQYANLFRVAFYSRLLSFLFLAFELVKVKQGFSQLCGRERAYSTCSLLGTTATRVFHCGTERYHDRETSNDFHRCCRNCPTIRPHGIV